MQKIVSFNVGRQWCYITDYEDRIPIVEFIADCTYEKEIEQAFTGATVVFHMAARPFSYDMYSNNKAIWRDNVIGSFFDTYNFF